VGSTEDNYFISVLIW